MATRRSARVKSKDPTDNEIQIKVSTKGNTSTSKHIAIKKESKKPDIAQYSGKRPRSLGVLSETATARRKRGRPSIADKPEIEGDKESTSISSKSIPKDGTSDDSINSVTNEAKCVSVNCPKCLNRRFKATCSQGACFKCCTDVLCLGHESNRQQLKEQHSFLEGTHWSTKMANTLKSKKILRKAFREKAFEYMEETHTIWNIHDFFRRDDFRDKVISRRRNHGRGAQGRENDLNGAKTNQDATQNLNNKRGRFKVADTQTKGSENDPATLKQKRIICVKLSPAQRLQQMMDENLKMLGISTPEP